MAKQAEIDYLKKIGEAGRWHAVHKPFSDRHCPQNLMQMGAVMALLPPLPARVLDVGCGTGWTSRFYARRGYEVVGVDIAGDMIHHANLARDREGLGNLSFRVSDYEDMTFDAEFDAAVFYDALHHAVDERAAVRMAYRALKPGGVCITSEPGRGHAKAAHSVEAVQKFGVTERDMPPATIMAAGRAAGFRRFEVYPHATELGRVVFPFADGPAARWRDRPWWLRKLGSAALALYVVLCRPRTCGLVVMIK